MKTIQARFRISLALAALLLAIGLAALTPLATAAEGEFSKPVIDIGMVVKDSERTAQFLTNCSVPRYSRELSSDRFVWNRGAVASCEVRTSLNWAVEILTNDVVRMFSQ
jgi:hypothetical protein